MNSDMNKSIAACFIAAAAVRQPQLAESVAEPVRMLPQKESFYTTRPLDSKVLVNW